MVGATVEKMQCFCLMFFPFSVFYQNKNEGETQKKLIPWETKSEIQVQLKDYCIDERYGQ